jgi:hypothetical protein
LRSSGWRRALERSIAEFGGTEDIDLSGEAFREEADRLERRLWGESGTKIRYHLAEPSPVERTESAILQALGTTGATGLEPATPGFGDRCSAS